MIKTLVAEWPQLCIKDELLYRAWINAESGLVERYQLIPPPQRRVDLIRLAHEGMTGGHLGLRRTLAQLQKRAIGQAGRKTLSSSYEAVDHAPSTDERNHHGKASSNPWRWVNLWSALEST